MGMGTDRTSAPGRPEGIQFVVVESEQVELVSELGFGACFGAGRVQFQTNSSNVCNEQSRLSCAEALHLYAFVVPEHVRRM